MEPTEGGLRRVREPTAIARLLAGDALYAAYPLGELETLTTSNVSALLYQGRDGQARAVERKVFGGAVLFLDGAARAVGALLDALQPSKAAYTCRPEHLPELRRRFALRDGEEMRRMVVDRASFQAAAAPGCRRLGPGDAAVINGVYATGAPGFVSADQVRHGVYYGCWRDGQLAAVAGTHFIAPRVGLASVGNVYTHPDWRGQGLAHACVGQVTADLLMTCPDVVLNVRADNAPALRVYHGLGYHIHAPFFQGWAYARQKGLRRWLSPNQWFRRAEGGADAHGEF